MKNTWMLILFFRIVKPIKALADTSDRNRMDKTMLEAILVFLRYISFPFLAIAIGLWIYSLKSEDSVRRIDSLKMLGVSIILLFLHSFAKASGLF